MSDDNKRLLEKQLWGVANVLRGKMNADEYKNYILGFIFYKYLSEHLEQYANDKLLARENFKFAEINENTKNGREYLNSVKSGCVGYLGYFLRPTELFSYLVKKGKGEIKEQDKFILEDLKDIFNTIEKTSSGTASEDDFKGLFDDVDLSSSKLGKGEKEKNEVIVEVLTLLNGIDFRLEDAKSDVLGDAYEYLIGEFAAGAGKKGGEFYTPAQVSRLLAMLVTMDKPKVRSVYDPTCGSGSLLLRIGDYTDVASYYGQELNPTTYNLARMNMILHGVHFDKFTIKQGDTLTDDQNPDLKAEIIVANPPFSAQWKGEADPILKVDERFSQYGRLAPKSAADYAFVTHMLHHLADNGTMAVVLPHGALFRSGAEGVIRKYIIEKLNYLDAVIGLPSNLFYGALIPATVLVFKKCREGDSDILFIDASKEFEKGKNQNKLTDLNIKKISETYKTRYEIQNYSHKASLKEIQENEYNLNIPRYIDIFEPEQEIDLNEISQKLQELQIMEKKIKQIIFKRCKQINSPIPDGNNLPLLIEYKTGIIQKIFSKKIRFKDDNGKDFPDWENKKLSSFLVERDEKYPKSDQYPLMAFVAYKGVAPKGDRYNREFLVNDSDNKKYKRTEYGDFIYSSNNLETGSIGMNRYGSATISPVYSIFQIKESYDYRFISSFLVRKSFINKMLRYRQGVIYGQWKIHEADFLNIEENIPSIEEQQEIAEFLTSLDDLIDLKQKRSKKKKVGRRA